MYDPAATRGNRRSPAVCNEMGARGMDTFAFLRALEFSTAWKA